MQPGQNFIGDSYLTCNDICPGKDLVAYGRVFQIKGVDKFTQDYFAAQNKHFPISDIEQPKPKESVKI